MSEPRVESEVRSLEIHNFRITVYKVGVWYQKAGGSAEHATRLAQNW